MSTSGIYTFEETRDSLIKDAYIAIGQVDHDEALGASLVQLGERRVNRIIQELHTDGIRLWKRQDAVLFLEKNKSQYALGPSGDNWVTKYGTTKTKTGANTGDTSISVNDTSNIKDGDFVGFIPEKGDSTWEKIDTVDTSESFTLVDPLDSDVEQGSLVRFYTSKAQKPLKLLSTTRKDKHGNEAPVKKESKDFYWQFANKGVGGPVTTIAFDPTTTNSTLYVWPESGNSTDTLQMVVEYPIEVITDAGDELDLPPEARNMLLYILAQDLAVDFKVDENTYERVVRRAAMAKRAFDDWDQEMSSMYIQPDIQGGY